MATPWIAFILVVGAILRVVQFAHNRSLWFDEALLALNLLHRPFGGLLQPLDFNQGAPIGFLLLEKLVASVLGGGEMALRLIPLLAGLAALVVFLRLAQACLTCRAGPLAVAIFALGTPLIYYSSEFKQYSADVLVTLLLLWGGLLLLRAPLTPRHAAIAGVLGAAALWFSHPATFVLAGIGLVLFAMAWLEHDGKRAAWLMVTASLWVVSFAILYWLSLRGLGQNHELLDFWRGYFPPGPLFSLRSLTWTLGRFFELFSEVAGLQPILPSALFIAGGWALWRKDRRLLLLLITPLLFTMVAAALHRYPLSGRLMLFVAPVLVLMIAQGADWVAGKAGRWSAVAILLMSAVLLFQPVIIDARNLVTPPASDDIKPALAYIRAHAQLGDTWYVYHFARYQYWYYAGREGIAVPDLRIGDDCAANLACYAADVERLRGTPRVWILFSHIWTGNGVDEEKFFLDRLDKMGVRKESFRSRGARAYLYDLSGKN